MSQFRAACFTLNNPLDSEIENLKKNAEQFRYLVFQLERGNAEGTLHLQGYIYSAKPKRLGGWKSVIGQRAHIEPARGSPSQNREYCTKEDTRVDGPWEFGSMPNPGSRTDIAGAIETAKEGASLEEIIERHPEEFVKYHKGLMAARLLFQPRRNWKTEVFWFYGETGTGKSRQAYEAYPDAYTKMPSCKWWDGYDGQDTVIVDDYRRDLCTFSELLRLFDRYPMQIETKGGTQQFLAKRIIITTPKSPRDTWAGRTEEDLQQLLRRIEHVQYFPRLFSGGGHDILNESVEEAWANAPNFNSEAQNDN